MHQLTLSFKPGLSQEFKTLRQCTQGAVLRTRGGATGIAPAVDMSPSQLARKLQGNADDPHRSLDIDDWWSTVEALAEQGDYSCLYWQLERLKFSTDQQKTMAITQLTAVIQRATELLADVSSDTTSKVRRR